MSHYDLIILGSGSIAFAAALRARELGKTAVITEERTLGGTCVNHGCLPSKNLIEAAKLLHDARHPRYPGLSAFDLPMDFRELIAQKDLIVGGYRKKKYDSLIGEGIDVKTGHAEFLDARTIQAGAERLTGKKILIATGSRPGVPDIDGIENAPSSPAIF